MKKQFMKVLALITCGLLSLSCIAGCGDDAPISSTPPPCK